MQLYPVRRLWAVAVVVAVAFFYSPPARAQDAPQYSAEIRWTEYGIPHVLAEDYGSLGFGQGYAFGQINPCILADQIVKVRSERARYFGPGENDRHITSDFGYKALGVYALAQQRLDDLPADARAIMEGYVAGFNRALADAGRKGWPARCRDAEWVRQISATDLLAYYMDLDILASGRNFVPAVGTAAPPGGRVVHRGRIEPRATLAALPNFRRLPIGSNGWAIGKDRSAGGRGMLLANSHLAWEGEISFWQSHLTIPGKFNAMGTSLQGVPTINIGFNEHVAWTHTVSTSARFTLYKLTLVEDESTVYLYDGRPRRMQHRDAAIRVRQPDGTLATVARRLYASHYGPILHMPGLEWSARTAFALKDANAGNTGISAQWLSIGRARTVGDVKEALRTYRGTPWVNTICADDRGDVFLADASPVPNLTPDALAAFERAVEDDPLTRRMWAAGIPVLDGSRSLFEWRDEGAPIAGIVPFARAPQAMRTDFVANSNDSHWATNPAQPLEGYSPLYGRERHAQSFRTRMGLMMLTDLSPGGPSGADGKFTVPELQAAMLSNRVSLAELLMDDLVARCAGQSGVTLTDSGETVDVSDACRVLAAWDRRFDADSAGAHLFREFAAELTDDTGAFHGFANALDPADPVHTPNGLVGAADGEADPALVALAHAARRLEAAGFALDAKLGDVQYTLKADGRTGLHGAENLEGGFNITGYSSYPWSGTDLLPKFPRAKILNDKSGLTTDGYLVNGGDTWILTMEFTRRGPRAEAMFVQSQSQNPESSHFADQLPLYNEKHFRPVRFTEEQILSDPALKIQRVTSR